MTNPAIRTEYRPDRSFEIGTVPIPVDASYANEVTIERNPVEAPSPGGIGEPVAYNNVASDTRFDIWVDDPDRIAFHKSYIKLDGEAELMPPGGPGNPLTSTIGIPWNSIAALISAYRLDINNVAIEEYNQCVGDSAVAKSLIRYTRDALESMTDTHFTPCIESVRDTTTNLSPETEMRTRTNLVYNPTGPTSIQKHSKCIPLSELFDSLRAPACFRAKHITITLRFKLTNEILFGTGVSAATARYYITGCKLYLARSHLTDEQKKRELELMSKSEAVYQQAYYFYEALGHAYSGSDTFIDNTVRNVQAAIAMFPSTSANDHIGINPYQYCYNCLVNGTAGITSYQMTYNGIDSPNFTVPISSNQQALNTNVYEQYRNLCRKWWNWDLPLALSYPSMNAVPNQYPSDPSPYVLLCSAFFPQGVLIHDLDAGATLQVRLNGATGSSRVIIMRIRTLYMQLLGNNDVKVSK